MESPNFTRNNRNRRDSEAITVRLNPVLRQDAERLARIQNVHMGQFIADIVEAYIAERRLPHVDGIEKSKIETLEKMLEGGHVIQ